MTTISGLVQEGRAGAEAEGADEPAWRAERRAKILRAAADLLREHDPATLRMDDVAARAGIGKATLYRYYASKDELLVAVFDGSLGELGGRLADCAGIADPMERLLAMIDEITSVTGDQLASLRMMGDRRFDLAEQWRRSFRRHRKGIVEALRATLAEGIAAGRLREVDLEVVPSMIVGIVRGALTGNLAAGLPQQRISVALRSFLVTALAADAPAEAL
jgi:AcrR family transcriptional regulator